MHTVALVIASSIIGLGCGCPTVQGIEQDRNLRGALTYQRAGEAPATLDLAPSASFALNSDVHGAYPAEAAFTFAPDEPQATSPPAFYVRLVVRLDPAGPFEIDLSDDVASLTVHLSATPPALTYHGVGGHLSVQGVDTTCGLACPLRARGTLTVTATGPDDEVLALASGTFAANDTYYDTGMCQD